MEIIEELRKEIDECDRVLMKTFEKRMELVMKILENKRKNNLPIFHAQREQEIMEKALRNINGEQYVQEAEQFLQGIMKLSRSIQSKNLFPYNIVLAGFMGTGKSTVGRDLSQKLEMRYVDTDAMIEERMGMTIKKIFKEYGEAYFRKLEEELVAEVSHLKNTIIFCGGGVVLKGQNVSNLKLNGRVILLQAEPENIYQRIKQDDTRPVLKDQMSLEGIENLLKQRNKAYSESADMVIQTDDKTVDEISTEIITKLYAMNQSFQQKEGKK
ncbi:chorismate mutase [Alkaliphilus metalliredigens QYMF]|uniref:Shikimate kinase n=1 Tax=Alkaliphilus metalliredigens (strain QYMF) TaxID=293826 RepID=A6TL08_ALKMQ|nr:chorismate mutase [Alkaliphilus metalliredigens]ABR46876.1 chorismate mutase [Alkaliphilus metalliredigens QYMF]